MANAPDTIKDLQDEAIAFLMASGNHGAGVSAVERIDTHGAIIFLAGEYAYKIKRAVRLAYLDFSTLEKRRDALQREFEVNFETAPRLYLALRALRQLDGKTLSFDGNGDAVEWVLVMKRFAQSALFDCMARNGQLETSMMAPLGETVADMHARAVPDRKADAVVSLDSLLNHFRSSMSGPDSPLNQDDVVAFDVAARSMLDKHAHFLRERAAAGLVRRCHGDLHLGNIVLFDGVATPFDALEFDEQLATIDTLYDLAFVLMDLARHGLHGHANILLNTYLRRQVDVSYLSGLALLPLFLACRASIRSMVAFDRSRHLDDERRADAFKACRGYFEFACSVLEPPGPGLVAIGGLSGTGKSTLGRALAAHVPPVPGAVHLRSDVERKKLFGVEPTTRLPNSAYSRRATADVYSILMDKARRILKAGHSVIVDAVFAGADERSDCQRVAKASGAAFMGLWLQAPADILERRVDRRTGDASDADVEVVRKQLAYELGPIAWQPIDASGDGETVLTNARAVVEFSD